LSTPIDPHKEVEFLGILASVPGMFEVCFRYEPYGYSPEPIYAKEFGADYHSEKVHAQDELEAYLKWSRREVDHLVIEHLLANYPRKK